VTLRVVPVARTDHPIVRLPIVMGGMRFLRVKAHEKSATEDVGSLGTPRGLLTLGRAFFLINVFRKELFSDHAACSRQNCARRVTHTFI